MPTAGHAATRQSLVHARRQPCRTDPTSLQAQADVLVRHSCVTSRTSSARVHIGQAPQTCLDISVAKWPQWAVQGCTRACCKHGDDPERSISYHNTHRRMRVCGKRTHRCAPRRPNNTSMAKRDGRCGACSLQAVQGPSRACCKHGNNLERRPYSNYTHGRTVWRSSKACTANWPGRSASPTHKVLDPCCGTPCRCVHPPGARHATAAYHDRNQGKDNAGRRPDQPSDVHAAAQCGLSHEPHGPYGQACHAHQAQRARGQGVLPAGTGCGSSRA